MNTAAASKNVRTAKAKPRRAASSAALRRKTTPAGQAGEIAWELEQRFTMGVYNFGETLSSAALVEEFDASRQPVGAAIAYLRARGYVVVIPQVGCRVVSPSPNDIVDMFVALGRVEGLIASFAADRQKSGEAQTLVAIAQANHVTRVQDTFERQRYVQRINEFHDQLMVMARSPSVCESTASWNRLSTFYLWQGVRRAQPSVADRLNGERLQIAEAVAAGKASEAAERMEAHIRHKPILAGVVD